MRVGGPAPADAAAAPSPAEGKGAGGRLLRKVLVGLALCFRREATAGRHEGGEQEAWESQVFYYR